MRLERKTGFGRGLHQAPQGHRWKFFGYSLLLGTKSGQRAGTYQVCTQLTPQLNHQSSSLMAFADSSVPSNATSPGAIRNGMADTPTRHKPRTESRWEKLCPKCGEWVGIGQNKNLYSYHIHLDGERCRQLAQAKARARSKEALKHSAISTMESPIERRPWDPFETSAQSIVPCSHVSTTVSSPLEPLSSLPSLVSPEPLFGATSGATTSDALHSPTLSLNSATLLLAALPPEHDLTTTGTHNLPTEVGTPCYGTRVKWECGHPSKTYPFQYHDTGYPTWSISTQRPPDANTIYLRSFSCALFHNPLTEACFECLKITSSNKFQSLVSRASKVPAPTVPWNYLSWEQLWRRLKERTDECRQYRKKVNPVHSLQIRTD